MARLDLERLLGVDVRADERPLLLLLFFDLLLLLTAYYILKVVREPLILLGGGAVSRSYARGLQAFLLLGIVPAYAALANRVEPTRLVPWITGFFAACLLLFCLLGLSGLRVGFPFFVWLGLFSTMGVAQLWSLASDAFTEEEGDRLFPVVAVGGTLGAVTGAQVAARAIGSLGPFWLMLLAAALLGGCVALTRAFHAAATRRRRAAPPTATPTATAAAAGRAPLPDRRGGFRLVLQDRYLLLIGLSVLALNVINTTGDFILAQMVHARAAAIGPGVADPGVARERFIGTFYGDFQTATSVLTALLQAFVVTRLFRSAGPRVALFFLPLLTLAGYGGFALLPLLVVVRLVKITENSVDYSLQNTLQQALFLPTSRAAKYKAKAATDTFAVRLGDLASAALVAVGVGAGVGTRGFSLANAALAAAWLAVTARLAHHHRRVSTLPLTAGPPGA